MATPRPKRRRLIAAASLFLMLATTFSAGTGASAAPTETPRLRLISPRTSVVIERYGSRAPVYVDPGILVASTRAPFEVRAWRDSYPEPIQAVQAIPRSGGGGEDLVPLPDWVLDGWGGLDRFFKLEVRTIAGEAVRTRRVDFCPNSWEQQRVNDQGPVNPTYPQMCGGNPLTRGMVWGIDEGWATGAMASAGEQAWMRIPDGQYRVRLEILGRYQRLFGIAADDAVAEIAATVVTYEEPCYSDDWCETAPRVQGGSLTPAQRVTNPDPSTLPDLQALPSYGIQVYSMRGRDFLSFGADVWNAGPAPLVVEGFRRDGADVMDAYQYFFDGDEIVGRARVGSLEFDQHRGHDHWHFRQFAGYRLLDATRTEVVRSKKQAFCLVPTDAIDLLVPGAHRRPETLGFGSSCGYTGSIWIRETLQVGWGDTYTQWTPGQSFEVTGLPNGTYFIEVRANPLGRLYDGVPGNDVSLRKVRIGGVPGARTVTVPPYEGIDTEVFYQGF